MQLRNMPDLLKSLYPLNDRFLGLRIELISLQGAHIDEHTKGIRCPDQRPDGFLPPLLHLVEADGASEREFKTEAFFGNPDIAPHLNPVIKPTYLLIGQGARNVQRGSEGTLGLAAAGDGHGFTVPCDVCWH